MSDKKDKYQKLKFATNGLTWVVINNPTEEDAERLKRSYKFHHLDLEDCLSRNERPKIDDYDDYLFLVLKVPAKERRAVQSSEIDIFVGQNFVVTLHNDNQIIKKLLDKLHINRTLKEQYMGKGSGYLLYKIIDDLLESGFPLLNELQKHMNELESEVFDRDFSQDRLKEILMLKKDIINFRRTIMPQRAIIAQLEHKNKKFLPENLDVYFDDIVDKIEKMWNNLENLQELTASLQETNESIISHNTNNIIKILTVFSVVMLPLTFVTGFYGMNVQNLPLAEGPAPIMNISLLLIGIVVAMIAYFKYRKWI